MNDQPEESFLHTRLSLISRLKNSHDPKSWDDFSLTYKPFIFGLLQRQKISFHDCEDLSQTVLLKVWKDLAQFEPQSEKGSFRRWLATVTNNTAREFFRKNQGVKAQTQMGNNELLLNSTPSIQDSEIEKIIEEEWQKYISEKAWALVQEQLDETLCLVFEAFLEGKSAKSIAEEFSLKENTVYVYRQRVEKKLMQEIIRLDHELA